MNSTFSIQTYLVSNRKWNVYRYLSLKYQSLHTHFVIVLLLHLCIYSGSDGGCRFTLIIIDKTNFINHSKKVGSSRTNNYKISPATKKPKHLTRANVS